MLAKIPFLVGGEWGVLLPSEAYAGHDHRLYVDVEEELVVDGQQTEALQQLALTGQAFLNSLYCARSLAKAIPQVGVAMVPGSPDPLLYCYPI